jgi:hypothetical protein
MTPSDYDLPDAANEPAEGVEISTDGRETDAPDESDEVDESGGEESEDE